VNEQRRIVVITGTRAEFGLLKPVMRAIQAHEALELLVYVTGTHLLEPDLTVQEVEAAFPIAARVPMQQAGARTRLADAAALGRGIAGIAQRLERDRPDVVLVLGDRIEAFGGACATSVAGIRVAHMHGGDLAEGIADEAMRHAITKLAHIHLPASARATERIIAMGEEPMRVHLVGSPAIDEVETIKPIDDEAFKELGQPDLVLLWHPMGEDDGIEQERAARLIELCEGFGKVLALHPNHDPGREGILRAIHTRKGLTHRAHLRREVFIGLLRRVKALVGNSSAGIIECAAIPCRAVDIGPRQWGRERSSHVIHCSVWDDVAVERAINRALHEPILSRAHPWGDGRSGPKTAEVLAEFTPDKHPLGKRNSY